MDDDDIWCDDPECFAHDKPATPARILAAPHADQDEQELAELEARGATVFRPQPGASCRCTYIDIGNGIPARWGMEAPADCPEHGRNARITEGDPNG